RGESSPKDVTHMIQTSTIFTITAAERDRVNGELAAYLLAVADLTSDLSAANARIAELEALLAPPHTGGLYVDGGKLYTKGGSEVQVRGVEGPYGPGAASNPALAMSVVRSFGANSVGPLYQPWIDLSYNPYDPAYDVATLDLNMIRAAAAQQLAEAREQGIVVLFNPDHIPEARRDEFLFAPETIALLQSYDNVILSLGVESYETNVA